MKYLPKNWITEGNIDFERKKYQLLAYLKESSRAFQEIKLYPSLAELVDHHQILVELKSDKKKVQDLFPKRLTKLDFENLDLSYTSKVEEGPLMREIDQIADFAIPRLKNKIEEGVDIYEYIEEQVDFEPVGLLPIYKKEGFILLSRGNINEVHAFRYKSSLLQFAGDRFRSLSLWLIGVFERTITNTLEQIKRSLINEIKELPNPATWRVHSQQTFPLDETLLPISKRLLLKSISLDDR